MTTQWEELRKYLPEGLDEKAKELKVMTRSRQIKTADDLLTLNLLYVTGGGSFQNVSSMMRLTAGIDINKNAVRKRIMSSWPLLQWISQQICRTQGFSIAKPKWLDGRSVILIDGTDVTLQSSEGTDYRLHYGFDLFRFECRQMELTTAKEGEKLARYAVRQGDIFIADRGYCTVSGLEYVTSNDGGFLVRYRSNSFALYSQDGAKLDILTEARGLGAFENVDVNCYYKLPKGELKPIRIVIIRKDEKSITESFRRMHRIASRRQRNPAKPETVEINQYIVLATNLDYTNEQISELYRARWQVEQVFYRLKHLFGLGIVNASNPDTVKAWFYGKLLVAALSESIIKSESFSPEQQRLLFGIASPQFME
jgi:hypothetical protein